MDTPLIISLPASDETLKAEVELLLKPNGEFYEESTESFGPDEIRLAFEIISKGIPAAVPLATVLYMMKDRIQKDKQNKIKIGPPGEEGIPLDQVDDQVIRRLEEWVK